MALERALGDRAGIRRYADALVPLDEALVRAVVDVSGRPYLSYEIDIPKWQMLGDYDVFLTPEFFRALVLNAGPHGPHGPDPRRQPAPHRRGGVQGVRPGARRRHQPRPAGRRRAVDQGRAVIVVVDYGVNNLKSVVRAPRRRRARRHGSRPIRTRCAAPITC